MRFYLIVERRYKMKTKGTKIIYKVTNKVTNKIYIGATTKCLERRKTDHLSKAKKGIGHEFHRALSANPEMFEWEQIDTASTPNELARKEREYILKYKSKKAGYNGDSGGTGIQRKVYQYSMKDGKLTGMYNSLEEAAKTVGVDKKTISKACIGELKSCAGFHWKYDFLHVYNGSPDKRLKPVCQCSLLSGEVLDVFPSVADASRATGVSKTCIAKVCRGEREYSGGYRWKYQK